MVAPKNIKDLQHVSRDLTTKRVDFNTYMVTSRTHPDTDYIVTVTFDKDGRHVKADCTCQWATFNGIACSHVLATLEFMAAQKKRTLSFWNEETNARRQKHRLFKLVSNRDDEKDQSHVWITSRNT
ncbi:MAG: SWIM zinc finger family protein [Phototrophicaceae bacterium]